MGLETWAALAGVAGFCIAIASGITKLIIGPLERRTTLIEEEMKEFRERYVRHSEMNGHLAHLDKSLDEAKQDIRDIRDLMQDFIKGFGQSK